MFLPRDLSPFLHRTAEDGSHWERTIADPLVRRELSELLYEEPAAFLELAAETVVLHGADLPTLVIDLVESGIGEGIALAVAIGWLCPDPSVEPPDTPGLPAWLLHLDQVELVDACRRREVHAEGVSSYLLEFCFIGGEIATLHVRVDHELGGALTNAFVSDEPLHSVRELFLAADRWRRTGSLDPSSPGYGLPAAKQFRRIKEVTARRALAGAVLAADHLDLPLDLNSPWPGIRPLVSFLLDDQK